MKQAPAFRKRAVWHDRRAIALLMAASLTVMANAIISPALVGLEAIFSDTPDAGILTRLLVPAPSLSVVLCAPLVGLAVDRFGRRGMLLAGVILFVITGSAGLYLPSLSAIFASRLPLGVAVAIIMTSATALIGDYFTNDQRSDFVGLEVSARNFGGFLFISLAGYIAAISPRLPFALYGLAALYLPFMWMAITEPDRARVHTAHTKTSDDKGGAAWRLRILVLASLQMVTNAIFFVVLTQLPFFFDIHGHDSATMTGTALGSLTLTAGCAALLYARVKRQIGFFGTYTVGYTIMALGFALLSFGEKPLVVFVGTAAIGAGYATVSPNFVAIALTLAPERRRGFAGGVLTTSLFLGQFLSPLLITPIISKVGYDATFWSLALLLGVMAMVSGMAGGAKRLHRPFTQN